MKKTRRLLLLILGGMGVLYLAVAAVMAALSQTLSPLAMAEIDADAQTLPMLAIIFGGVGVILLTVGVSLFVGLGRGEKKRRDLLDFGQIVEDLIPADVNVDGEVNISDINAVIDIIQDGDDGTPAADVNGDGEINIADINAVIHRILSDRSALGSAD